MRNLKALALISILFAAVPFFVNTQVKQASAITYPVTYEYTWMGGYLNTTFCILNLTEWGISHDLELALITKTVMNTSLDFWEDKEAFEFKSGAAFNVSCPEASYIPAPSAIYSKELSESFGFPSWYIISMQWRDPSPGPGYGNHWEAATGDVDYHMWTNGTKPTGETAKYAVTDSTVVEVDTDGNWIGDGTNDPAGSMWARQPLFINVTFYLGNVPPLQTLTLPIVQVDMDSWLTTGDAYANVTMAGHPLDGIEVSGTGYEWDSERESAAFISCGAEVNMPAEFLLPGESPGEGTPVNVSYIYAHKHLACRSELLLEGDATGDGKVNVWDKGRLVDSWLIVGYSTAYGNTIGELEEAGLYLEAYKYSRSFNSVDFDGNEKINVWDKGILVDQWQKFGWKPGTTM